MFRQSLETLLRDAKVIPVLTGLLAPGQSCHLVGGALRNLHLGLAVADFDFILPQDPTDLAREFAKRLGAHWFGLDDQRRQSRVVLKTAAGPLVYDFAPWRAATLEGDLALRDYTINAMAVELLRGGPVPAAPFDPLGGRADLASRLLRCCSDTVLRDDPLRVLKGVRHSVALGLWPDEKTFERMTGAAPRLTRSAPERIRAELGQIFCEPYKAERFVLINRLGLETILFGAPGEGGGLRRATEMTGLAQQWLDYLIGHDTDGRFESLLCEPIEEYWPRQALVKLAAFLCGYKAADTERLARERLRLGRRATAFLKAWSSPASRLDELQNVAPLPRSRALWVDSLGPGRGEALVVLLCSASVSPQKAGPLALELLTDYLDLSDRQGRIDDLVGGHWIRDELGVRHGPLIGEMLQRLRSAQIEGSVRNADEARQFLRALRPEHQNKH